MNTVNYQYLQELASVADEYCQLIEHLDQLGGNLLEQVSCLLPRLHAAVAPLESEADTLCGEDKADLESRFELFMRHFLVFDCRHLICRQHQLLM